MWAAGVFREGIKGSMCGFHQVWGAVIEVEVRTWYRIPLTVSSVDPRVSGRPIAVSEFLKMSKRKFG